MLVVWSKASNKVWSQLQVHFSVAGSLTICHVVLWLLGYREQHQESGQGHADAHLLELATGDPSGAGQ